MFTGEAYLAYDDCKVEYSPCTLSLHPRDDRTLLVAIRLNGVKELVRVLAGGGDAYAFDDARLVVTWPQARFHFASDWEFLAFKRIMADVERVFGLRQLQETFERDTGIPVETLPDLAPAPRDWHPNVPARSKERRGAKAGGASGWQPVACEGPTAAGLARGGEFLASIGVTAAVPWDKTKPAGDGSSAVSRVFLASHALSTSGLSPLEASAAALAGSGRGAASASSTMMITPGEPTVRGSATDPTDPRMAHITGKSGWCHACKQKASGGILCPNAFEPAPAAGAPGGDDGTSSGGDDAMAGTSSAGTATTTGHSVSMVLREGATTHLLCVDCLESRGGYDYHAVRSGAVAYACPVCAGACTCSKCRSKRGDLPRLRTAGPATSAASTPRTTAKAPALAVVPVARVAVPMPGRGALTAGGASLTAAAAAAHEAQRAARDKYGAAVRSCSGVPMPVTEGMALVPLDAGDGKRSKGGQVASGDPLLDRFAYKYTRSLGPLLTAMGLGRIAGAAAAGGAGGSGGGGAAGGSASSDAVPVHDSIHAYTAHDLLPTQLPTGSSGSSADASASSSSVSSASRGGDEAADVLARMAASNLARWGHAKRRCNLCRNPESFASSRRRLMGLHPLVPVDGPGNPVVCCEHCNAEMLRKRAAVAATGNLNDVKDGYENVCALCGHAGSTASAHTATTFVVCSAQLCPRSYCAACATTLLKSTKAVQLMKEAPEWLCPPCASVSREKVAAATAAYLAATNAAAAATISASVAATSAIAATGGGRKKKARSSSSSATADFAPDGDSGASKKRPSSSRARSSSRGASKGPAAEEVPAVETPPGFTEETAGGGASASSSSDSAGKPAAAAPGAAPVFIDPCIYWAHYARGTYKRAGAARRVLLGDGADVVLQPMLAATHDADPAAKPVDVDDTAAPATRAAALAVLCRTEDECFGCKDGGDVVECDHSLAAAAAADAAAPFCIAGGSIKCSPAFAAVEWPPEARRCSKVYHDYCLVKKPPEDEDEPWHCPRHKCENCKHGASGAMCRYCPRSLCARHGLDARQAGWRAWHPAADDAVRTPDVPLDVLIAICPRCLRMKEAAIAKGLLAPGSGPEDAEAVPLATPEIRAALAGGAGDSAAAPSGGARAAAGAGAR